VTHSVEGGDAAHCEGCELGSGSQHHHRCCVGDEAGSSRAVAIVADVGEKEK